MTWEDKPEAVILVGDESFCDGLGWYYYDAEYPEEGVCGSFVTREEAIAHAREAGYTVRPGELDGALGATVAAVRP